MINVLDKIIYFPRTFNEQMTWIDEEVEYIIKYNDKYNIKKDIQEKGRAAYGEQGYTHAIKRLFEIVKSDQKNKAVLHEVFISNILMRLKQNIKDDKGCCLLYNR